MDIPNQKFKEVKCKSRAGVTYTKYELVPVRNPVGYNHTAKRKLNAQYTRLSQGRPYYVLGRNNKRIYFKDENPAKNN